MELRIYASEETFEEIDELVHLIAALTNNHMFLEFRDFPEIERRAEIQRLKDKLEELFH
jgi:hypothetical protein